VITGKPAKAVATLILGKPMGELVGAFSVRPPTDTEKEQWACGGLTVGDVWTFEMEGAPPEPRQFVVSWK